MAELLQKGKNNGGIDLEIGLTVYSESKAFYRTVRKLERRGLVNKQEAPFTSNCQYVWKLTETAKEKLEAAEKENGGSP